MIRQNQSGFDWFDSLVAEDLARFVFMSLDDIVGSAFYLVEGEFGSDSILSNCCQAGYDQENVQR